MRPGNRYERKTLGQLVRSELVLVAVCRRCRHEHMIYPAGLIGRFGEDTIALDIRPFLRCRHCGAKGANLHEASR
jgi:ribosomal protein L40E